MMKIDFALLNVVFTVNEISRLDTVRNVPMFCLKRVHNQRVIFALID